MKKTALITGASRGLGKALAHIFGENGYNLILHCKDSELPIVKGVECEIIKGDLILNDTLLALAMAARERDVDVLINNAGIYLNKSFPDTTADDFRELIDVNLTAPILLTEAIWPIFQKKQAGIVININSIAGKHGGNGETAYCASKHGLSGFSKALQFDATKDNIRVVDVFMGAMQTDMTKGRAGIELLIKPEEAAKAIFKLCHDYQSLRMTEVDISRRNY